MRARHESRRGLSSDTEFTEDTLLATHIDSLLFPLRKTQPEFYAEYRARREVVARSGGTAPSAETPVLAAPPASATPALIQLAAYA